mmetsp:Transcript_220/g.540  ORF Transcript_220/g.540 Transcript_220/m.540 type:complete len:226 (+) Transcript_220:1419-2096(+)
MPPVSTVTVELPAGNDVLLSDPAIRSDDVRVAHRDQTSFLKRHLGPITETPTDLHFLADLHTSEGGVSWMGVGRKRTLGFSICSDFVTVLKECFLFRDRRGRCGGGGGCRWGGSRGDGGGCCGGRRGRGCQFLRKGRDDWWCGSRFDFFWLFFHCLLFHFRLCLLGVAPQKFINRVVELEGGHHELPRLPASLLRIGCALAGTLPLVVAVRNSVELLQTAALLSL